ncbi:MAG: [protein-PII] uridylyltransferase [Acidimicrobiales bacterium]
MLLQRDDLFQNRSLTGSAFAAAHSELIDSWIRDVAGELEIPRGAALAAIGGYGRQEMAPHSDLDIVLVHRDGTDVTEFAEKIWYPMWDSGLRLGQRVDTIDGLLDMTRTDLDTATALLDCRHLAGDETLALELAVAATKAWKEDPAGNAARLAERVGELHDEFGEVAFMLGPNIKSGRGGLRDVHTLGWAEATGTVADLGSVSRLREPYEVLLRARVELHRLTGRHGDRLVLEFQDDVAEALEYPDADALMADIASAARSIAWNSDANWFWLERSLEPRRRMTDTRRVDDHIGVDGWLLVLSDDAPVEHDPAFPLRVALAAARNHSFIDHETLLRLAATSPPPPEPWPEEIRAAFSELLLLGRSAIAVIEAFDQVGLMSRLIPEWEPCRSRPQRNAYHRFTVDRHLLEAAAQASHLADRVERPDLLVVGALLHDIGKGYPGDHTDVGVELIEVIARRMGFDEHDVEQLVAMCAHHLLLPDVATRRDLDDDGTISTVADTVGTTELLDLLAALTEADSIATGPAAWNSSKAELVHTLADRTRFVLRGGEAAEVVGERFPGPEHRMMIARGEFTVRHRDDTLTVVQVDSPGSFSRVAGVLTMNGLDILSANAHTENGIALSEFTVRDHGHFDAGRIEAQLAAAARREIAIEARVDERRRTYASAVKRQAADPVVPTVDFDNDTSDLFTVIEVTGRDQIGLLYRISRALTELGVEISAARIQTIGDAVVDAFYATHEQAKLDDTRYREEIERAVLHAIKRH